MSDEKKPSDDHSQKYFWDLWTIWEWIFASVILLCVLYGLLVGISHLRSRYSVLGTLQHENVNLVKKLVPTPRPGYDPLLPK